jgi:hypothetical protein
MSEVRGLAGLTAPHASHTVLAHLAADTARSLPALSAVAMT